MYFLNIVYKSGIESYIELYYNFREESCYESE